MPQRFQKAKRMTSHRVTRAIASAVAEAGLASILFWTPDIVVHAVRGQYFSGRDVFLITVLLPVFAGVCLVSIWKKGIAFKSRARRAILPVLGIWVFGPLMLMISATVGGGGFANLPKGEIWQTLSFMAMFPVFTFIGSTYDGTLGAVMVATFCLPLLGILARSRRTQADDSVRPA